MPYTPLIEIYGKFISSLSLFKKKIIMKQNEKRSKKKQTLTHERNRRNDWKMKEGYMKWIALQCRAMYVLGYKYID